MEFSVTSLTRHPPPFWTNILENFGRYFYYIIVSKSGLVLK